MLHHQRVDPRSRAQRTHRARLEALPEGTFIRWPAPGGRPHLVLVDRLLPYAPEGYGAPVRRPVSAVAVEVLTPPATVAVLRAGYRPELAPLSTG